MLHRFLQILAVIAGIMGLAGPAAADTKAFATYNEASEIVVDHSDWANFLATYVKTDSEDGVNRVKYAGVSEEDRATLQQYIADLSAMDPTSLNRDEAFAYWANLYNAVTVEVILDNYPVKEILKIRSGIRPGPWKRKLVTISGEKLSLDDIEHGTLREYWDEPRVHYAVNCASYGCPNLAATPFTGADLEEQLEAAAVDYVNHPRGVSVEGGKLKLSQIYKWYRKDFGSNDREVIGHLRLYASDDLKASLEGFTKINKYDYDWSLNEVK